MITEIEVPGKSISLKCWNARVNGIPEFFKKLSSEGDVFALAPEMPGFHDCDANERIIRGFYSCVTPFEVEHLVDGITTKTLHKRIESVEFILAEKRLFTWGNGGPAKALSNAISALSGYGVTPMEFETFQMRRLESKLSQVKKIDLDRIEIIRWIHLDRIARMVARMLESAGKPPRPRSRNALKQRGWKKSKRGYRS